MVFSLSADMALQNRSVIDREYFGLCRLVGGIRRRRPTYGPLLHAAGLPGELIHGRDDCALLRHVSAWLHEFSGRVVWNSWPTGVAVVTESQHHGGPFPATSNPLFTSVKPDAIMRFLRPVAFKGFRRRWCLPRCNGRS